MALRVLATDYDGTLATNGAVDAATVDALRRFRAADGKLLLVTGRQLPDLQRIFSALELFDRVVAENGAVLYDPATADERVLCDSPDPSLVAQLRRLNVPLSVGRVVIATVEPYDAVVRNLIAQDGLKLRVIHNKGSVMVLPTGVDKASGLRRALMDLSISAQGVVAIGDAENDAAFLAACGFGVAVANALPALKSRADLVTRGTHGAGVVEVIDQLLTGSLAGRSTGRFVPPQ